MHPAARVMGQFASTQARTRDCTSESFWYYVCRIRSPLTLATWAYIAEINGKMTEVSSVDK